MVLPFPVHPVPVMSLGSKGMIKYFEMYWVQGLRMAVRQGQSDWDSEATLGMSPERDLSGARRMDDATHSLHTQRPCPRQVVLCIEIETQVK